MSSTGIARVNKEALQDSLRGGDRDRFPVVLGTGLDTGEDFLRVLKRRGYQLSEEIIGYLMGGSFKVKTQKTTTVTLVTVTPEDLGYAESFGFGEGEMYDRARQLGVGLSLCPPEAAFQILIQAYGQSIQRFPMRQSFELATKPIWPKKVSSDKHNYNPFAGTSRIHEGLPGNLLIRCSDNQLGVDVVNAHSARLVSPDNRFAFVLK